jgi:hypothetical protein
MTVRQPIVRTDVHGAPMDPSFLNITIEREFATTTRTDTYLIGVQRGTVGGVSAGGPTRSTTVFARWEGDRLVIDTTSASNGTFVERTEVLQYDAAGMLTVTLTERSTGAEPSTTTATYRRNPTAAAGEAGAAFLTSSQQPDGRATCRPAVVERESPVRNAIDGYDVQGRDSIVAIHPRHRLLAERRAGRLGRVEYSLLAYQPEASAPVSTGALAVDWQARRGWSIESSCDIGAWAGGLPGTMVALAALPGQTPVSADTAASSFARRCRSRSRLYVPSASRSYKAIPMALAAVACRLS